MMLATIAPYIIFLTLCDWITASRRTVVPVHYDPRTVVAFVRLGVPVLQRVIILFHSTGTQRQNHNIKHSASTVGSRRGVSFLNCHTSSFIKSQKLEQRQTTVYLYY